MVFAALFACMALALTIVSETNLAVCRNRRDVQQAENLAETGLLLVQREMGGLVVSGADAAALHTEMVSHFKSQWAGAHMLDCSAIKSDASGVTFPQISLPGPDGRTGTIWLTIVADGGVEDAPSITVTAVGRYGGAVRTAYYDFHVQPGYDLLRDYGMASRSPIYLDSTSVIDGANNGAEASIFSCSDAQTNAIELTGKARVTGDAAVSAPGCEVHQDPNTTIGGDVQTGVPEYVWPEIDTARFEHFVEAVYSTEGEVQDKTLINVRIAAGTNPTFAGNTQIYGVVYVESPNVVTFEGNANICGIVVCEPSSVQNLSENQINFSGGLVASGVEYLPSDARFNGLRDETGTFLLAPGYAANFSGNFSTINGAVVASQFDFAGTASGTVRGHVLNLADTALDVRGGAHVTIDKSDAPVHPAGFAPRYVLLCIHGSYRE
jgi:hypothetical protein